VSKYATAPAATEHMPPGVPYIVGNEAAERFSFYGMKGILITFMTKHLVDAQGKLAVMNDEDAKYWYHMFVAAVYFLPLLGGLLADTVLGKYRTIMILSVVYCAGHLALALDETRMGLAIGLGLISLGSGGIKPCVSAHVGDQFGSKNKHLIPRVFGWFYFAINSGAFASTLLIPILLERFGPSVAFGVPGIAMFLATVVFWLGRNKFVHIPPGGSKFVDEVLGEEGIRATLKLSLLFAFILVFWALYDQSGSAWVLQARNMDRTLFGHELLESQIQAVNPLLILLFIPLFDKLIYPAVGRVWPLTPLRKIGAGFVFTAGAFAISAVAEQMITDGGKPSVLWQILAYVALTAGEVMVSITGLEYAYTQAPRQMKSFVMSLYLLSVSLGNLSTALVNKMMLDENGKSMLPGADYYWFFAAVMLGATVIYIGVASVFPEKTYVQEDEPAFPEPPAPPDKK